MGIKITASIVFLGTGADSYLVGKALRSAGGIIIQINENQLHLDPGPGSLTMAKRTGINLRANTSLLISNNNIYNCNDLNVVIDSMTYSGFDKKGVLISTQTLINGSEKEKAYLTNSHKEFLERFIVLQSGQRVGINEVEIQALKTIGSNGGIGFKVFTPNFTLSYSSDTKYSVEIAEQYKDSGILILNMVSPSKENNPGLNSEDVVKIIKKVNPRLAILTGFGTKMIEADPLCVAREIQKETGVQTIAAKDGMEVSPVSYSAQEGQRTFGTLSQEKKLDIRAPEQEKAVENTEKIIEEVSKGNGDDFKLPDDKQETLSISEEQSDNQQNNL